MFPFSGIRSGYLFLSPTALWQQDWESPIAFVTLHFFLVKQKLAQLLRH